MSDVGITYNTDVYILIVKLRIKLEIHAAVFNWKLSRLSHGSEEIFKTNIQHDRCMYLNSLSSLWLNLFIAEKVRKQMAHKKKLITAAEWSRGISALYLDPMPSKYLTDREVCRISGESSFQPDLIDNALATRQRCPKPRESTRNRRYFSHEQPIIIPHANGKNATAPLRTGTRTREALL